MSLQVDGVWKGAVWAATPWAAGVWREGAPPIPPTPPEPTQVPAGRRTVRNIYRIKVDGQSFEFKSLADAITFLERAKQTALTQALEARRQATELQARQITRVKTPVFELPKIEASSRDLRGAVTATKRDIADTYKQAQIDTEIAILFELNERERHNEEILWLLL